MNKLSQTKGPPKARPKTAPNDTESFTAPPPKKGGRTIGIDAHPDTFTIVAYKGTSHHDAQKLQTKADMTLEQLLLWAEKNCNARDILLMEAGGNSFELHWKLSKLGLHSYVLESAHVGKHAKSYVDNDKIAAGRIALVYLGTQAPCVWVPDDLTRQRRELLHIYNRSVKQCTESTNALKGYLNQYTIRLGKRSLAHTATYDWILNQKDWSPLQKHLLEDHFEQIAKSSKRKKKSLRLMAEEISSEPRMLSLMSLLGIGVVNAYALIAIIGDIKRFANHKKLAAYLGLNPGIKDSGKSVRIKKGIGNRGRKDMRTLLVQAAHSVLRKGKSTELRKWGMRLLIRKGNRNIAVGAVARKLSAQVWHLLSGNTPTQLEPSKSRATKLRKLLTILGKELREQMNLPSTIKECLVYYDRLIDEHKDALLNRQMGLPPQTRPS